MTFLLSSSKSSVSLNYAHTIWHELKLGVQCTNSVHVFKEFKFEATLGRAALITAGPEAWMVALPQHG